MVCHKGRNGHRSLYHNILLDIECLVIRIMERVRTICNDTTTSGYKSTQLHLRDFFKMEIVYLLLHGIFFSSFFFWLSLEIMNNTVSIPTCCKEFHSFAISCIYFEPCSCHFQFLDLSFLTGRKNVIVPF